jgi:hypothetical protein
VVGYRNALFTLAGGLFGAVAFSYAQPWLDKVLVGTGPKVIFTARPEDSPRYGGGSTVTTKQGGQGRKHDCTIAPRPVRSIAG